MRSRLANLGRGSLWGNSLRLQPSGRRRLWLIVLHTLSASVVLYLWEGLAVPIGLRYSRVLDVSMVMSTIHIDSGLHLLSILMIIKSNYQYQPTLEDIKEALL